MPERWVTFQSSAFEATRPTVLALRGSEALNEHFEVQVELVCDNPAAVRERAARLLDDRVALVFEEHGRVVRHLHGVVSELSYRHEVDAQRIRILVTVVPRVWELKKRYGAEPFVNVTVPAVLRAKLEAIGLHEHDDFVMALTHAYPTRELIVQYEETDLAFFQRLCEHDGIVAFFQHEDGRDVLVLTDTTSLYEPISHGRAIPVSARREHPAAYDVVTTLKKRAAVVHVHDYNYRSPRLVLSENRSLAPPSVPGAWVEYGAHTKGPHETQRIAQLRAEAGAAAQEVTRGGCTELSIQAGRVFALDHDVLGEERLLITRVRWEGRQGDDDSFDWDNHFEAVPTRLPFRPPRRTERPRISGLINARVDGEVKGHYAELDSMGRYHVQLGFDRTGRTDMKASHPVRMMQPHAGSHYGMHFPLRPGTEVLVGFVDGNPDRPLIVGAAPNPETWTPVDSGNYTQNVLRTKSDNELVIEDELGSERIRLHTPKLGTTLQLGSQEEPEEGALTATEGSISHASRVSHNVATDRQTLLARDAATLAGNNAIILAGVEGLSQAATRGLEKTSSLVTQDLAKSLTNLALPPGAEPVEMEQGDGEGDGAEAGAKTGAGDPGSDEGGMGGLWSEVGRRAASTADAAAFDAVRTLAESSDASLARSGGRSGGERLGTPLGPATLVGAPRTSALFGRDTAFVYGDRAAALSSDDTAMVVGSRMAEIKSPGRTEVAGGEEVLVTTSGVLSVEAALVRVAAGYYPDALAPPLDDGTSLGLMARRDLRVTSVEDCILLCAQKNIIGTAHEGDIRLTAKNSVIVRAGGIHCSAGTVTVDSKTTRIKATSKIEIEAPTVIIKGNITLDGPVTVTGNLKVLGEIDVKKDSKLASG
jgi:type VI secretion system secreted protein VgrG